MLAFDDEVGAEDRILVERVQLGVASGLLGEGRLLPESEQLVAHFQSLVVDTPRVSCWRVFSWKCTTSLPVRGLVHFIIVRRCDEAWDRCFASSTRTRGGVTVS